MKLIVGLGNPGEKYAFNRHNIGFMAVEELALGYRFAPWKKKFQGVTAEGQIGVEKCVLLKPATYMNDSGRAVGEAMRFYKLGAGDVMVIHDEIDLPPGKVRVKTGGGNAGHNGLKSISAHIGNEYVRVRLGIGHPGDRALVSNYVLSDFAKPDRAWLSQLLENIARGMARLVEGSEAAFLSEAARVRTQTPAAEKNGAAPAPMPVQAAVKIVEPDPIEAILAAAAKPIAAMTPPAYTMAAREMPNSPAPSKAVPQPHIPAPVAFEAPEEAAAAIMHAEIAHEAASTLPGTVGVLNIGRRFNLVQRSYLEQEAKPSELEAPKVEEEIAQARPEMAAAEVHIPAEPIQAAPIQAEMRVSEAPEQTIAATLDSSPQVEAVIQPVEMPKSAPPPKEAEKRAGSKLKSWFRSRFRGEPAH